MTRLEVHMATDPVCGMMVDTHAGKPSYDHQGHTYHFCSDGCRIKFAGDPGKLPTKTDGDADEDAFAESELPGEIGETEPGATGTLTVTLPAGRYVMLCNVPAHYKAGMYGTLTVT